ncbi:O-antigen/teichoic acid export membrane protein [Luteococcus japonicus]|uniref:O-antigen/teichoic acid export membrane protein n=1 Tax=Luteococcus japonicus TaxID=33984 RepID=A0A3N1ZV30_9ACTN|nr:MULTISPECIES: lipopolysaccharide biosynthesis protein [Luteococcus]MDN5563232.1 lipopolysaccharide biosynthesis protein [Luteococcus sp.]ROR54705.1 O-antigen/teichoic acid export membrane protein [Luteococcus japonicus]
MSQSPAPLQTQGRAARLRSNTFLKHVLTLMTGTAVAQLIPLAATPFLARMYTDHEFGIYTLFMALAQGITTVAALRYDMAVVVPEKDSDARGLVKLASRIALCTSLLASLVFIIWAGPLSRAMGQPDIKPYLPLVGLLALGMTQISSRQYWLNRRQRYKEMARNRMGQSIGTNGVQLGAGLLPLPGPLGLVLGPIVGQWFSFLNLYRLTRHETKPQPEDSALAMAREHRKMPLLNGPNALVDTVRLQGINVMIAMFFSGAVLGQFGQAWRLLSMPMGLINQALSQVFFQKLATTRRGSMFAVVRNAILRSLAIGVIPFGLIWLLAPWLFPFVLGAQWAPAGQIARILVPWLYLNFVTSPVATLFITVRRQGVLLAHAIVYMAVPLALIWRFHSRLTQTLTYVSWSMAGLLLVFLMLALMVARQYDRGIGMRPGEDAGSEVTPDEKAGEAAVEVEGR